MWWLLIILVIILFWPLRFSYDLYAAKDFSFSFYIHPFPFFRRKFRILFLNPTKIKELKEKNKLKKAQKEAKKAENQRKKDEKSAKKAQKQEQKTTKEVTTTQEKAIDETKDGKEEKKEKTPFRDRKEALRELASMIKPILYKLLSKLSLEELRLTVHYYGDVFYTSLLAGWFYAASGITLGFLSSKLRRFPEEPKIEVLWQSDKIAAEMHLQISTNLGRMLAFTLFVLIKLPKIWKKTKTLISSTK